MKNASSLKSTKTESPKTPGGISKSLLTPCRRLGLSRSWKKVGPSPFISPLSSSNSNSVEVKLEKRDTRKRKERVPDCEIDDINKESPTGTLVTRKSLSEVCAKDITLSSTHNNEDIIVTPSRHVQSPRKKKSKTLISAIKENATDLQDKANIEEEHHSPKVITSKVDTVVDILQAENLDIKVSKQVKLKGKLKRAVSPMKSVSKADNILNCDPSNVVIDLKDIDTPTKQDNKGPDTGMDTKPKSPIELTKECIVVIQKKIFKTDKDPKNHEDTSNKLKLSNDTENVQTLDSDSDEVPLCHLNKIKKTNIDPNVIMVDEDDDFTDNTKGKKLSESTSMAGVKATKKKPIKNKSLKQKKTPVNIKPSSQSSNSFDDDDDFDLENKRTILIRKTYDKVTKPLKAKSTGSITQRDIDELKARIEMKKKLLVAKAVTKDTEELRGLIKKWQKGCQDALVELMELMKTKCPEKQNMDYSEMLQTLKIPAALVGYDSDNDCFTTPDDSSIILSKFNI